MSTTWQCLSVREFVDRCNWQGVLPTTVSSPGRLQDLTSWQCLTTQKFFSLSNWDGRLIFSPDDRENAVEQTFFDLTLPSKQFWQCFNWSGNDRPTDRANEVLQDTQEIIAAVEEFTLNDLSQLF